LCTKKHIFNTDAGQSVKGQQGSSFPVLLFLTWLLLKKNRAREGLDPDGVTGRGCFLLGKID
jgi:hypothetical protein